MEFPIYTPWENLDAQTIQKVTIQELITELIVTKSHGMFLLR